MKLTTILVPALLTGLSLTASAQDVDLKSGKLDFLRGQKTINVVYSYDNMGVGKGTEDEYVNGKVEKYNKDEPGKGDKWKAGWLSARTRQYQPKFEELLNKQLNEKGVKVGNYPTATYTLVLKTTFTEPGFNVGVMRRPAFTNTEAVFVKTGTTAEEAVITMTKAPGRDAMGYDFDAGERIGEAYAKSGKSLGAFLIKKKAI